MMNPVWALIALGRIMLHFPVGFLGAWLLLTLPLPGVIFCLGFLIYEVVGQWVKKDYGHLDILGFLLGLATGAILFQFLVQFPLQGRWGVPL